MAPVAISITNGHDDTSSIPNRTSDLSEYRAASTQAAIESEYTYAAHNYHPLPIVFSRAAGTAVWDPEGLNSTYLG